MTTAADRFIPAPNGTSAPVPVSTPVPDTTQPGARQEGYWCCKLPPAWLRLTAHQDELFCGRRAGHEGPCVAHLREVTIHWPNPVRAFGTDRDLARPLPLLQGRPHAG